MGYKNVLHTSSIYGITEIETQLNNQTFSSSGSIENLKNKEREFYQQFGTNNYKEFQAKVIKLFENNEDTPIIQKFSPGNLNNALQRFSYQTAQLFEQDVILQVNLSSLEKANAKIKETVDMTSLKKQGIIGDFSALERVLNINLKYNSKSIKNVLNKLYKDRKFNPNSSNMQWADNLVQEAIQSGAMKIYLGQPTNESSVLEEFKFSEIPNFPWGVKKKDIEIASRNKQGDLYQELVRAARTIKDFIFLELGQGASPDLKKAMLQVWQGQGFYGKVEEPLSFFKGTTSSNFISAVAGSFGEFQTAVIISYLNIKLNNGNSKIAQILGDTLKRGEKVKVDVQLFNRFGVQVKHYNTINKEGGVSFLRDIDTTIHPIDFDKYGNGTFSLSSFLANYYFNTDYQQEVKGEFQKIKKGLGEYLGELMNMAMNDSLLTDTVTFYFIGGQYFVPCSAILEGAMHLQSRLKDSIEITSAYKGLPDLAYEVPILGEGKNRKPLFTEYWRKTGTNGWRPTGENFSTYYDLISKDISIRTHFDYWEELEDYALFSL